MKNQLRDLKLVLVYIYEYVIEGKKHSVVLKPIDAANGVILEETFDGSGLMRGLSITGSLVQIPIEGITNHFQSWWKVDHSTNQGHKTYYVDDAVIETKVENAVDQPDKWDENGTLKGVEGKEKLPEDTPNGRIIRGK